MIAHASDGNTDSKQRTINLTVGTPSLSLERTVTRVDNYFDVVLTMKNHANATWDAEVARFFDYTQGFQVIKKTTQARPVSADRRMSSPTPSTLLP